MKSIARHLNLIGVLLLVSFAAAAAGLYLDVPQKVQAVRLKLAPTQFACPMHPQVTASTASDCPECGMKLVALSATAKTATPAHGDGCCNKTVAAPAPAPAAAPAAAGCPHLAAAPKPGCGDGCSRH
jgi:hypothetical protein